MSASARPRGDASPSPAEVTVSERPEESASELEAIAAASVGPRPPPAPTGGPVAPLPLGLVRAARLVDDGVEVDGPGGPVVAAVDASVHRDVIAAACERREMLLVAVDGAGLTVVGALRTQPTPGVDAMDTIRLEARRVEIVGGESVDVRSGVAALAVRAVGEIETYADRIVSRAEEVQKIIGRMLRLN